MRVKLRMGLAVLLGGLVAACSDSGPAVYTGVPDIAATDESNAATWTEVYTGVIQVACAGCHNPGGLGGVSGKLDMSSPTTAYANLVNIPAAGSACGGKGARVIPRNAPASLLYLKVSLIDQTPCGAKMPLGGPALPQSAVDQIASWIAAGAMNN